MKADGTNGACADLCNDRQPYKVCLNVRVGGGSGYCRCTFFFFFLTRSGSLRIESHLQGERARPQSGAVSFTRGAEARRIDSRPAGSGSEFAAFH